MTKICARTGIAVGLLKLGMIPCVKHLCAELQSRHLTWKRERLLHAQVPIVDARTRNHRLSAVPEIPYRRDGKTAPVEPQEPIVADIAGEAVAASIANTIGQRRDKRATR